MNEEVERELFKATGLKKKDFDENDRQAILTALTKGVAKLKDPDYEALSDPAVAWFIEAAKAFKARQGLPDFDEVEVPEDDVDDDEEEKADSEEETEEETEEDGEEGDDNAVDDSEDTDEDEEASEDESDEAEEPADDDVSSDEEDDSSDDEDHEAEAAAEDENEAAEAAEEVEKEAPKRRGRSSKARVEPVRPTKEEAKVIAKALKAKALQRYNPRNITGAKDRFGVIIGTKKHDAVKMYEKGTTMKAIEDAIGGKHYNVLKELTEQGHTVEKLPGGVWKLIHKDDLKAKKSKK